MRGRGQRRAGSRAALGAAVIGALLLAVVLVAVTGFMDPAPPRPVVGQGAAVASPRPVGTPTAPPTAPARGSPSGPQEVPPSAVAATIVVAGDVLTHRPVLDSARTADGGYDLVPLLEPLRPWVAGADLALCHLEVPLAPLGTPPSGYPLFGAPPELVTALQTTGWDGCSTASNHSLDRGTAGVTASLDALDAAGMGHVGTARSTQEAALPQLYELRRGDRTIRVAHLAATYGTNGMPLPASAPWTVTLLDTTALVEQARAARAAGADLVVASVHCCVEYVSEPTAEQERIAAELAASGQVDLLVGHHAHVPQPVVRLPGGPRGTGMWAAYGLGNLLSNQDAACCSPRTSSGLLLSATARVPAQGPATIGDVRWTAVTVDRRGGHRVHPVPATVTTTPLGTLSADEVAARHAQVREVVGTQAPEGTTPPEPTGPPPTVVRRP